jgi:hypothetical protein
MRAKVALTFVCDQLAETVDVHAFASIHEGERESVNKTASEAAAIAIAIVTATATAKEEALADVDVMAKLVEAVAAMVPVASSERPEAQRAPS